MLHGHHLWTMGYEENAKILTLFEEMVFLWGFAVETSQQSCYFRGLVKYDQKNELWGIDLVDILNGCLQFWNRLLLLQKSPTFRISLIASVGKVHDWNAEKLKGYRRNG